MKISELVEQLQKFQKQYGDMPVVGDWQHPTCEIDDYALKTPTILCIDQLNGLLSYTDTTDAGWQKYCVLTY